MSSGRENVRSAGRWGMIDDAYKGEDVASCRPRLRDRPALLPLAAFNFAYVVLLAFPAWQRGEQGLVVQYVSVVVVVATLVLVAHRTVRFSAGVLWVLSIWGLLHLTGGLVTVPSGLAARAEGGIIYSLWLVPGVLRFDQVVHAVGFGAVTVVCWQILEWRLQRAGEARPRPSWSALLLCVAAGNGFGAWNEMVEFGAAKRGLAANIGDYDNTGWDLVFNLLGSLLAAWWIRLRHGRVGNGAEVRPLRG